MSETTEPSFWRSSGLGLVARAVGDRLKPRPELVLAYLRRPELALVDESCPAERLIHDRLLQEPATPTEALPLAKVEDAGARESFEHFLTFRDHLLGHDDIETAYLALFREDKVSRTPPLFIDHLVHLIVHQILLETPDPFQLRAAETLFRTQKITVEDGAVLAADEETVEMLAEGGGAGGLAGLLAATNEQRREIQLDIVTETSERDYLGRSDRFDMVLDLTFARPGLDALARVLEKWVARMMGLRVRIQPRQRLADEAWRWHIGLDRTASSLLNRLYDGDILEDGERAKIIALFQMEIEDRSRVAPAIAESPVYLGLAMDAQRRLRLKPQNLLLNLPLAIGH